MIDNKKKLGQRIRELRKVRKLTQEALAEQCGIEQRHMSRIETGSNPPSFETLDKIALNLDVKLKDLFAFDHLNNRELLINELIKLIKNTETKQLITIYKIVEALEK